MYYWDSYFACLGLLARERKESLAAARNVADCIAQLLRTRGFAPTANRTYYLTRSQPPVLALLLQLLGQHASAHTVAEVGVLAAAMEGTFWTQGADRLIGTVFTGALQDATRLAPVWVRRSGSRVHIKKNSANNSEVHESKYELRFVLPTVGFRRAVLLPLDPPSEDDTWLSDSDPDSDTNSESDTNNINERSSRAMRLRMTRELDEPVISVPRDYYERAAAARVRCSNCSAAVGPGVPDAAICALRGNEHARGPLVLDFTAPRSNENPFVRCTLDEHRKGGHHPATAGKTGQTQHSHKLEHAVFAVTKCALTPAEAVATVNAVVDAEHSRAPQLCD